MGDAQDLKIGHAGSYSVILDQGEGNLSIGGDGFVDIMNTALDEYKARFTTNGSVELYWDNNKKFETTGYGATVFGETITQRLNVTGVSTFQSNVHLGDGDKINLGDNDDFQIFHHSNGTGIIQNAGSGQLQIRSDEIRLLNQATDEDYAFFRDDGAVELYYDNVKRFETSGIGVTITGETDINGDLNVSGVSTFTGAVDINSTLDVDGDLNVSGVTTTGGLLDINAGGQANTFKVEDLTDNRIVIAGTGGELEDDANLTFNSSTLFVGVDLDVDGHAELDNVNISGVTTIAGNIDANGDLDVDGHTNLDNVNVSGVSTFVGVGTFNSDVFVAGDLNVIGNVVYTQASAVNLEVTGISTLLHLNVDGHTDLDNVDIAGVTTTSGLLDINAGGQANTFKVEDLTDNRVVIAGTGGELEDDANLTFNGSTLSVGVELDVDGHTELDNVAISGVSTFTGNIDANGDLDVDGTTELDVLNVAETATFSSNIDANGDLDVDGHTELDELRVSGVSTFVSLVDINSDIDVDGHTNLDNVDIAGVTTTSGLLDINAGGQANTFKVEDLTNDRIIIAGTGGELEDDANLTFNGTQLFVGVELDVDGHTELDNVNVSGIATVENLRVNTDFDVYDTQAVFHNNVHIDGNLSIGGTTTVLQAQDLKIFDKDIILGVTTDAQGNDISTDITANHGGVAVASTTGNPLVNLTVPGLEELPSTYKKIMWFQEGAFSGLGTDAWLINYAVGIGSTQFPTGTRLAVGGIQFSEDTITTPNITISEDLSITGDLDVDGHTNLDNVSIAGVTTFAGNIDADGNLDLLGHLDIDGHTELDNLNVTGVSTFSGNLNLTGDIISNLTITSTDDGSAAAPEFKLFRNSSTPADADYLGQIKFAGESDTGVERNYAKITGKILDASNGTEDGIIEFAHIKAGSQTITARFRSDSFQLLNDTNLTVAGDSTFTGNIDANGDLDVDGHTNLDNVSVAGVTTFAGAIDANDNVDIAGILDVDGHTELDNVAISGVTTFSGAVDANANVDIAGVLDVDGHTELDNVAISGVTTFSGYLDANANVGIAGNLDVDGHTDLDNVSISGVTTFTGAIDANGNLDVAGTLDVDGHTELDNVNASGIVTATGFVGPITGNVTGTATTATKVEVTQSGGQTDHYVMLAPSGSGDSAVRLDTGIRFHTGTNSLTLGGATVVGAGLSVVGVSTFTGDIDSNGRIVGAATSNLIPFLYSTFEDLPNASTYHGAFAHAHNRGKGYFAHSSNWYELVNKELNGTVGTGTERYDIGYIDATGSNITGVSTAATSQAATLNVGAGGTVLTASVDTSKVGINSTAPAYALDVVGDINSSTDIKVNGVSIVVSGTPASTDDVVALAIALG
jgi:cytoskeletal protein CcmA (bactofilin family)